MPKENRFAGLGEAMDGDGDAKSDTDQTGKQTDESQSSSSSNESAASTEEEIVESSGEDTHEDERGSVLDDEAVTENGYKEEEDNKPEPDESESDGSEPAFEFEATTAKSIYVRRATLDQLDDAEFEVESLLRKDHDIRNLTGREFHDALVRIATEHPDEIVEAILETRDE
ncbi:hypothetical protein [Haloferax sp. DFSO60]|uniref:hypothetical protein n=1 Tax=Haloferax sp. DFSO60 TaxID=3388652 RepID=UPI00397A48F4